MTTRAQLCRNNPGRVHTHVHKAGHAATPDKPAVKMSEAGEVCTRACTDPSTAAHTNTAVLLASSMMVGLPHTVIASLPKESYLQPDLHLVLSQLHTAKLWVEPQRASSLRGRSVVQEMRWCRDLSYLLTTPSTRR